MGNVSLDPGDLSFLGPSALLIKVEEALKEVGSEGFFRSPKEHIKEAREALAFVFLLLALEQQSRRLWWGVKPPAEFPDLLLLSVDESPFSFVAEGIELTEIPMFVSTYEEAKEIVLKKLNKGYPPGYNLLVFINNLNSNVWLPKLKEEITDPGPFKAVWTLNLFGDRAGETIEKAIVSKIVPKPVEEILVDLDNLKERPSFPDSLFDPITINGQKGVKLKEGVKKEFVRIMKEAARRARDSKV